MFYLKISWHNIQEILDTMKSPNLRLIGIEEGEEIHIKGPERLENIFNKTTEENFPNRKKVMPINIKEAYRTSIRLDQKTKSS